MQILGRERILKGLAAVAFLSGALQIFGYAVYLVLSWRSSIDPNPTTWMMWAYGTALLTLVEWSLGAPLELLILPIACASSSILVAALCWRRGTLRWPEDRIDRLSLITDLTLTALFLLVSALLAFAIMDTAAARLANIVILVATNATTFISFVPMLRGAAAHPTDERPLPWLIWSSAYLALLVITVAEVDGGDASPALLIYPASNTVLHGAVAWLSRPSRRQRLPA